MVAFCLIHFVIQLSPCKQTLFPRGVATYEARPNQLPRSPYDKKEHITREYQEFFCRVLFTSAAPTTLITLYVIKKEDGSESWDIWIQALVMSH